MALQASMQNTKSIVAHETIFAGLGVRSIGWRTLPLAITC